MRIFIGCCPWSIGGHTHRWRDTSADLSLSFSMPQTSRKIFNKPFEFLLYKTSRLHFNSVCVYCNRSLKTSQRVKNNSHATRVVLFVLYTLWRHLWSITVHTMNHKNIIDLIILCSEKIPGRSGWRNLVLKMGHETTINTRRLNMRSFEAHLRFFLTIVILR